MFKLRDIDTQTRFVLETHGFERVPFAELCARLARGPSAWDNTIREEILVEPLEALTALPPEASDDAGRLAEIGRAAIEAGQVGAIILNGGMATRFGGVAKGVTEALDGRSFLDLKLAQIERAGHGHATPILMNSFATEAATAAHLALTGREGGVRTFSQFVAVRSTPQGEIFLGADGSPSLYAPGHGDLPDAIGVSGELRRFVEGGGRYLTVSNVDNLAAGLSPQVIGAHIEGGRRMTVEVVETHAGDVGGFPARVGGRLAIVEAFRLPFGFDQDTIPVFNTNTFVIDAEALADPPELDWFVVEKRVDGRTAVQFERLVGQLSEHLLVTWLVVPRDGASSRFLPIKVPGDLVTEGEHLRAVLQRQGVLR